MKTILSLVLLMPTLLFSQVSSWRNNPPQQRQDIQRLPQSSPQRNDISRWRTQTEPIRPGHQIPTQPLVRRWRPTYNNPYGLHRGTWGWYQPYPYIWYDSYGWRQRSEVRIYENGRRDTIPNPIYYTAGLGHTNNKQSSFWGAIGGGKGYFILDYVMTYDIDRNQYFPHGNLMIADFPISKDDFRKESTIYLGVGKHFGKVGIHGMIGFGREVLRYQGKDGIGGISFPKSDINFTTFKFGILRDYKFCTLKVDYDPIRKYTQIGVGLNNR
jgi:hypothetical protein